MDRSVAALLPIIALLLILLASTPAPASEASAFSGSGARAAVANDASQKVIVTRSGSQPSRAGPAEYFTGSVRVDPLFQAQDPPHTSAAYVTFEPGARSAWHTHPLGQILVVTAGTGRVQRWGDPAQGIQPGDVVWIPPGQKHWHGASPATE